MSKTTPRTESSSPPGHQDQSARLAASAPVDQVGGTPTLEQFQRWLEDKAHEARHAIDDGCDDLSRTVVHEPLIADTRCAYQLLLQFKLEQGV